jgi:hypothetical protein
METTQTKEVTSSAPVTPVAPQAPTVTGTPATHAAPSAHPRPMMARSGRKPAPRSHGMRPSRPPDATQMHKKVEDTVPALGANNIRIIPLGGVEEIGKNMTMIEYGNDIIVIDIGLQFKEESTPGIDYILPNTKYLEERKDRVRAVIITHGHLDHIGGIPYVMPRIGNPPLYTRMLTSVMIKKRQEEFTHFPALDIKIAALDMYTCCY